MKSFIGMSYLVKRGKILLQEDLKKKKSQVKEALLIKELSPKLKRDSSLDLTPMYGALIWSGGVRSSRHWSLS